MFALEFVYEAPVLIKPSYRMVSFHDWFQDRIEHLDQVMNRPTPSTHCPFKCILLVLLTKEFLIPKELDQSRKSIA
jgi:hypothetical protein